MAKLTNETKVGILGAAAIALLILGFSFLKGSNILSQSRQFYAEYSNIGGVLPSDPVTFNGQRIGRVQKTYLKEDYSGSVMVIVNITDPVAIRKDAKLQIISSDLLGSKAIKFTPGKGELAVNKDTLIGVIQPDLQQEIRTELEPMVARTRDMIASIDSAVQIINSIVGQGDTEKRFSDGLLSITHTLKSFERISYKVDKIIDAETETIDTILSNLQNLTAVLNGQQARVNNIIENVSTISDTLVAADFMQLFREAKKSIDNISMITDGLAQGQGSLGKLLVEEDLYNNLNVASKNLDNLILDLQENPDRYVTLIRIGGGNKKKNRKNTVNQP